MKNLFRPIFCIAVAAMSFSSCQKTENITRGHRLLVHASEEEISVDEKTRTHIDSDYNVIWDAGETMQIFCAQSADAAPVSAVSETAQLSADGKEADFSFTVSGTDSYTEFIYAGVYPVSAVTNAGNDGKTAANKYKLAVPNVQSPTADAYDPDAFIMVAKPQTFTAAQTEISQYFRKAVALNDITFSGCTFGEEKVSLVKITLPDGSFFAGRRYIDLTSGEIGDYTSASYSFGTITLNYETPFAIEGSKMNVRFTSWGVEFSSGTMTVEVETDAATYTREIIVERKISFIEGAYNILEIDMSSAVRSAKSDAPDYSGEWLIVGVNGAVKYAAKKYDSGNNLKTFELSVGDGGVIYGTDGIEDCKMTLKKEDSGTYAGMYTIQDAGGNYLYAADSDKNCLKGSASLTKDSYWDIKKTAADGTETWSIVASKSSNRNVMQFNTSSSVFSCYSAASSSSVALVSCSEVDWTPTLSAEDITDVSAKGVVNATADITVRNIETVSATPDGTVVTAASVSGGILTYTVSANSTAETREGSITLSADGVASVTVKVVQVAGGAQTKKTFTVKSSDVVDSSAYQEYSGTLNGNSWVITFGGNSKSVGTNSNNRKKCTLSSYSKYAVSPVTTSSTASAFASTTKLQNVVGISYAAITGNNQANTKIYLIHSENGTDFSQIELTSGEQGSYNASGDSFSFNSLTGYFAVVFVATNTSGNWRLDNVDLTFTYLE